MRGGAARPLRRERRGRPVSLRRALPVAAARAARRAGRPLRRAATSRASRDAVAADRVAIVGARRATEYGLQQARGSGRGLAAAGLTVVSGMALGVDAAAHVGALEADGLTLAVLACGPERPYPASKRRLHARIADAGAIIAELPPGTPPRRWCFPARNRIIAALGLATVVIEAGERSGSLITAGQAADLGREVGAVPGPRDGTAGRRHERADRRRRPARPRGTRRAGAAVRRGRAGAAPGTAGRARPDSTPTCSRCLSKSAAAVTPSRRSRAAGRRRRGARRLAQLELRGLVRRGPVGATRPPHRAAAPVRRHVRRAWSVVAAGTPRRAAGAVGHALTCAP